MCRKSSCPFHGGRAIACLIMLTLASACFAFDQPRPFLSVGSYRIDTKTSRVHVRVNKATRFGHAHGIEGRVKSGSVRFDPKSPGGEIVFDLAALVADSPEARKHVGVTGDISQSDQTKITRTMLAKSVLDIEKFPTSKFVIRDMKASSEVANSLRIVGDFTIHGVMQSVNVDASVTPSEKENGLRLQGSFTIKQTDFGIKPYRALGGLVRVSDKVKISGDFHLQRLP